MPTNKKSTRYRLSDEIRAEIEVLSDTLRCSKTQVIETAVALYFAWVEDKERRQDTEEKGTGE